MTIPNIKRTVLLFVTDYEQRGSGGKVKGAERLVGEVSSKCEVVDSFLVYRPFDKNGFEVYAGINLCDVHSFRLETIEKKE